MHVLTLNIEHLGMGRLGYAGLYAATADLPRMLKEQGIRVSEVWWNTPTSQAAVVAEPMTAAEAHHLLASGDISAIYTQYVQTGHVFEVAAHAWPAAVPIVSICHDLTAAMDPIRSWLGSPSRHASDAIVISSSAGATALQRMLEARDWELANGPADVAVLPLGTFLPEDVPSREESRVARGWEDDVVFLWLGRFSARYKADLRPLLLAFRQVAESTPDARLVSVGGDDGTTAAHLRRFAEDLGIADRCEWFPDASAAIRDQCLTGADVLINVADHVQETFGLAIIEAMACGLPVIAADWSGFRDLVLHNVTGLLVPTFLDAEWLAAPNSELFGSLSGAAHVDMPALTATMLHLARHPTERRRMGEAGRRRASDHYSWRALGPRYVALLEERHRLARNSPPRRSPRGWMPGAFSGFATHQLRIGRSITAGSVAFESVVDAIDENLRAAAERVHRHFETTTAAPPVPSIVEALTPDTAALRLLLKLDVLRIDDGKEGTDA